MSIAPVCLHQSVDVALVNPVLHSGLIYSIKKYNDDQNLVLITWFGSFILFCFITGKYICLFICTCIQYFNNLINAVTKTSISLCSLHVAPIYFGGCMG